MIRNFRSKMDCRTITTSVYPVKKQHLSMVAGTAVAFQLLLRI